MPTRKSRGATLLLVAACSIAIIIIGFAIYYIVMMFGGNRELMNATDSGSLNVAKQAAVNPGIALIGKDEQANFGDLLDTNGMVTLRTINQVIGRALLIGLNAQVEGTPQAAQNASKVLGLAQTNANSICARLYQALAQQNAGASAFQGTAGANSVRMLATNGNASYVANTYQVAYMNAGSATNVYFPANTPTALINAIPTSAFSQQKSNSGQQFLVGYQPITITVGSNQLTYYFVPLNPGGQPHLVSNNDFASSTTSPLPNLIPPNSFQCASSQQTNVAAAAMGATSSSLASCLQYQAQISLPSGYLTVTNPPGVGGLTNMTSFLNSLFTDELASGIYLASDSKGNPVAFSTNPNAIAAWAAHNKNPSANPQPKLDDSNGNPVVYDSAGNPATLAELQQISAVASPTTGCNTLNVGGNPPASTICNQMLGSFENAFPHSGQVEPGDPSQVMAVAYWGQQIFQACGQLVQSLENANAWNQASDDSATTTCCTTVTPTNAVTGLELFNRYPGPQTQYPFNPNGSTTGFNTTDLGFNAFPTPGTPTQLGNQVNPTTYPAVIQPPVYAAIRQIKPEATDGEIAALLNSQTLLLDSIHYIYMSDPNSRTLTMSVNPPASAVVTGVPDGTLLTVTSGPYETIGYTVDNWFQNSNGGYNIAFQLPLDPSTTGLATDTATFQPSSGFDNYLGNLEFYNGVAGPGTFCGPN
jgi:hypothetical protein